MPVDETTAPSGPDLELLIQGKMPIDETTAPFRPELELLIPSKRPIDESIASSLREIWAMVYTPENGTGLTFPETVHMLSTLGVSRYRVDFVTSTTTAYIGGSACKFLQ
jgi:hypothetical protein